MLFHVFLLNIIIGGDLLVFNVEGCIYIKLIIKYQIYFLCLTLQEQAVLTFGRANNRKTSTKKSKNTYLFSVYLVLKSWFILFIYQVKSSWALLSFRYMWGHTVERNVVPHRTTVLHKYRQQQWSKTLQTYTQLTYWQILTKFTIYKCLPYTTKDKD